MQYVLEGIGISRCYCIHVCFHIHEQRLTYVNMSNLCMISMIRCVSLHLYSRAGCLHWSSSWAPRPVGRWATCGQLWRSPLVMPDLAGACGGSGAQRTAPRPPPSEAHQPGRRPLCNSQNSHAGDLCRGGKEAKCEWKD